MLSGNSGPKTGTVLITHRRTHHGRMHRRRCAPLEGRHRAPGDERQFPRDVRLLPVRVLRDLHRPRVLPGRQRVRLADVHLHDVRRRVPDAPARRGPARRLRRPDRPAPGPDRDALDHGVRHGPDRLRAGLCDDRPAGAGPRADRPAAARLLRRRRAGRRVRLPLGDGAAGPQGLLRVLAVRQPAGRHHGRRRHRLRGEPRALAPDGIAAWGWRIPFFIGCAIVPFLFYIRRSLEETPRAFLRRASIGRARSAISSASLGQQLAHRAAWACHAGRDHHDRFVLRDHGLHPDLRQDAC